MYVHKPWKTFFAPTIIKYEKPTVNDYSYDVPTIWLDKTTDICYMLVDNTMGAAVWVSRENSSNGDSVWILYGTNACYLAGNVGIGTNEPINRLTVTGTMSAGGTGSEFLVSIDGDISCGFVNAQTISSEASFTGTVNVVGGFKVAGEAAEGKVLRGNGTVFTSSTLTKNDVGLGNVDNTSDADKPISDDVADALEHKADLGDDGYVLQSQLPPSVYLTLGEGHSNAYYGDLGKAAYDHSQLTSSNPHNVTKADVNLGFVDNTSDIDKPASNATKLLLDLKADLVGGLVPVEQLPPISYQVVNYANASAFPTTGSTNIYYLALDTMYVYLWGGAGVGYVMITGSLEIADNAVTMAKLANLPNNTVIGNVSGIEGDPKALNATELRDLIGTVGVATDSLWDAVGDLAMGTGANSAERLARGTTGQVLTVDATGVLKWATPTTGGGTITDVTASSPLISTEGTEPNISIPAATSSSGGYATAAQITKLNSLVTNATHTGDVTGSTTLTIAANAVSLAKIQQVASGRILYRASSGTGNIEDTDISVLKSNLQVPEKISSGSIINTGNDDSTYLTALKVKDSGLINTAWAAEIQGCAAKTTIADADLFLIEDSAGNPIWAKKQLAWSTAKTNIKSYCDTLYAPYGTVGYNATTARNDLISALITYNDTTHAPSGKAVFDKFATKADLASPTFTGTVVVANLEAPGLVANTGIITAKYIKVSTLSANFVPMYSVNGLADSSIRYNSNNQALAIGMNAPTANPAAWLTISNCSAYGANLRLMPGTAEPSSPNIGDLWFIQGTGVTPKLYFRKDGSTNVDLLAIPGASQWITSGSNIYYGTTITQKVTIGSIATGSGQFNVSGSYSTGLLSATFQNVLETGYADVRILGGTIGTGGANFLSISRAGNSYSGGAGNGYLWNYGTGKLSFGTNGIERIFIDGTYGFTSFNKASALCTIYACRNNTTSPIVSIPYVWSSDDSTVAKCMPVFCAENYNSYTASISGTAGKDCLFYPSYYSRVFIEEGAGLGVGTTTIFPGVNYFGLLHSVQNRGMSQSCAAVHFLYNASNQSLDEHCETSALEAYYNISGNGTYLAEIFETIVTVYACGPNTGSRGIKGWYSIVDIYDAAATNAGKYRHLECYVGHDLASSGQCGTFRAHQFLSANGKWERLIGANIDMTPIPLNINVCALDLYTNITYENYAPALKIGSTSYIDLYGNVPHSCYIQANSNGNLILNTKTYNSAMAVVGLSFFSDANSYGTYLRIGSSLYLLSVVNGVVNATIST